MALLQSWIKHTLLREFGWEPGDPIKPFVEEMLRHGMANDPRFVEAFMVAGDYPITHDDMDHHDTAYEGRMDWEAPNLAYLNPMPSLTRPIPYRMNMVDHRTGQINSVPTGPSKKIETEFRRRLISSETTSAQREPMTGSYTVDSDAAFRSLSKNLLSAMLSAEKIVRREHIKADRIERVNHFITCLRREFTGESKHFVEALCKKEVWYDIGVVSPNITNSWLPISASHLEQAMLNAKRLRGNMEDNKSEIEHDLKELGTSIYGMDSLVSDMKRLNDESDGVLSKLSLLFPAPVERI